MNALRQIAPHLIFVQSNTRAPLLCDSGDILCEQSVIARLLEYRTQIQSRRAFFQGSLTHCPERENERFIREPDPFLRKIVGEVACPIYFKGRISNQQSRVILLDHAVYIPRRGGIFY